MKPLGDPFILESKTVTRDRMLALRDESSDQRRDHRCDSMQILEQALNAARSFRPLKSNEIEALLAKTKRAAQHGKYELYKTTHHFDGTIKILDGSDESALERSD